MSEGRWKHVEAGRAAERQSSNRVPAARQCEGMFTGVIPEHCLHRAVNICSTLTPLHLPKFYLLPKSALGKGWNPTCSFSTAMFWTPGGHSCQQSTEERPQTVLTNGAVSLGGGCAKCKTGWVRKELQGVHKSHLHRGAHISMMVTVQGTWTPTLLVFPFLQATLHQNFRHSTLTAARGNTWVSVQLVSLLKRMKFLILSSVRILSRHEISLKSVL